MIDFDEEDKIWETLYHRIADFREMLGLNQVNPADTFSCVVSPKHAAGVSIVTVATGNGLFSGLTKHKVGKPWVTINSWNQVNYQPIPLTLRQRVELGVFP